MAHNNFSEKLDQISIDELGFSFDESAAWKMLEAKLNRKTIVLDRKWLAVACMFIAILMIPFSLTEKFSADTSEPVAIEYYNPTELVNDPLLVEAEEDEVLERVRVFTPIHIEPKKIELSIADVDLKSMVPLRLEVIEIEEIKTTPQFALEDISIIQASLEGAKVEKGKNLSIRAQWQTTPNEVNVNYQALKIKLYEKEKKQ